MTTPDPSQDGPPPHVGPPQSPAHPMQQGPPAWPDAAQNPPTPAPPQAEYPQPQQAYPLPGYPQQGSLSQRQQQPPAGSPPQQEWYPPQPPPAPMLQNAPPANGAYYPPQPNYAQPNYAQPQPPPAHPPLPISPPPAAAPPSVGGGFPIIDDSAPPAKRGRGRRAKYAIASQKSKSLAPRGQFPQPVGKNEEPQEEQDLTEVATQAAPPWLISAVFHGVVLIIAALLYIAAEQKQDLRLSLDFAEELGEQLIDDSVSITSSEFEDIEPTLSEDLLELSDPFSSPPELAITLEGPAATSLLSAPAISTALEGRDESKKKSLLKAYGGTRKTEEAVKLGLEWLKRQQQRSGLWSLSGPYNEGLASENRTAATAMALLAFQGAGHTHRKGEYKRVVARGWQAFLKEQDRNGNFYPGGGLHNHRLYSQAQATIALCEIYGMTKDSQFLEPAQRALDYAVKIQATGVNGGGWRYTPGQDSDTSVTGWFVMALQSGRMAGLNVPQKTFDNISAYLDTVQSEYGRRYSYILGYEPEITMTAEGLLCRQYLGWPHDDNRLQDGAKLIARQPISYAGAGANVYYWYYATQVMHHMGGKPWEEWNRVMRVAVPANQVTTGRERGSWEPRNDRWGVHGGRLFTTCLNVYILEVYYRHLPLYQHREE